MHTDVQDKLLAVVKQRIEELSTHRKVNLNIDSIKDYDAFRLHDDLFYVTVRVDKRNYIDDDLTVYIRMKGTESDTLLLTQPLVCDNGYDTPEEIVNLLEEVYNHALRVYEFKPFLRRKKYSYVFNDPRVGITDAKLPRFGKATLLYDHGRNQ